MLTDTIQSTINSTISPPNPLPSFPPPPINIRTPSSLALKTFALRIAVLTAYGHLGTLQNLTATASTSMPRMLILFFFPGAVALELLMNYLAALVIWGFRLGGVRWRGGGGEAWEGIKYSLMIAAGLCVPDQDSRAQGAASYAPIPMQQIPLVRLIHVPATNTNRNSSIWDTLALATGRTLNLLAALAQTVTSLVLIVRRRQVPNASLLLDSTNGIYALIGILSAINALLILLVGGKWELIISEADLRVLQARRRPRFRGVMLRAVLVGVIPLLLMESQTRAGVPSGGFAWFDHAVFLDWMPGVLKKVEIGVMLNSVIWIAVWRSVPYWGRRREGSWRSHLFEPVFESMGPVGIVYLGYMHVLYWVSLVYELVVFAYGREMAVWGTEASRWYDPLTDTLFIY